MAGHINQSGAQTSPGVVPAPYNATPAPALVEPPRPVSTPLAGQFPAAVQSVFIDNGMTRLAAVLLGCYLALHACYMPEFMGSYFGFSFPVVAGTGILIAIVWAVSGQHGRFFQSGVAIFFLLTVVWWLLAAGIHSFKGFLIEMAVYAIRFHSAPIIFCGILLTLRSVRIAMTTYALGFVVSLIFTWRYGQSGSTGRYYVPETSLANPNDLALNLLLGAAFMTIFLVDSNLIKRAFWLCCTLGSLYFMLRTGSRANLITLVVMTGVAWFISSGRVRLGIIATGLMMLLLFAALVPHGNWARLTTFESASNEDLAGEEHLEGAIGSTIARKNLQIRAAKITLMNPLFGIGPRMFAYALDDFMRTQENYNKGTWQHPHNTYLDISAETGLIGVGLYAFVMLWCLRTNYRNVRWAQMWPQAPGQALGISSALLLANVTFGFGTLFCSIPYTGQFPFLVALTVANTLAMRDAGLQKYPPRPTAPVPAAPPIMPPPYPTRGGGQFAYGPAR